MRKINICLLLFFVIFVGCKSRTEELIMKGNELVVKIENFKLENDSLPNSLLDIGESVSDEGPIYYVKKSSNKYIVYFGTSLGESKVYSSEKGKWEE